jgi:hypothetical protein
MTQTQTQTQNQTQTQKIKTIFKKLKKKLPLEAYDFKILVDREFDDCEFWFEDIPEPNEKIELTENILIEKFDKEYNQLICIDKEITIIFKNSIYLDYLEENKIILLNYEVEVKENE